jgi:hypothetical protein
VYKWVLLRILCHHIAAHTLSPSIVIRTHEPNPVFAPKAEIEEVGNGTGPRGAVGRNGTDENNHMIVKYCALMTLIGGAQMLAVIFRCYL